MTDSEIVSSRKLVVLAFHKIGVPSSGDPSTWFYIPKAVFENHLKCLRDSGWQVIDADAFVKGLTDPKSLPPRSALITFDDGYRSIRHTAVPVLCANDLPSVLFVPTSFIGGKNRFDQAVEPEEEICDWDDLFEVQRSGVSVQSHGVTHRRLSELGLAELRRELWDSKSLLESQTGQPITLFSFPYGDSGSNEEITATELCRAGYRAAFLYGGGLESMPPTSCYSVCRLPMGADTDLQAILGMS